MLKNTEILNKLLSATTAEEVDLLVKNEDFFKRSKWVPIGGIENLTNEGRVEGQMKYPENAFVEKITNSIDAILMKKCRELGIDPTDKELAPKSLQEAIEKFIGGEKGFEKLRKIHSDIVILAEGKKDYPTLTIIDRGEGQEPERLPATILGLSNKLKADIAFVYGKYHQGGSASLRFAGTKPTLCYQLVLSKRASTLKPGESDWGFALVKKVFPPGSRLASYQYCKSEDDKIFTVPSDTSISSAQKNDIDFPDGTLIKVYDYQLLRSTSIVYGKGSLAEDINKKLLQPAVPIHLREIRSNYAEGQTSKSTQYTIGGLLRVIKDKGDIIKEDFSVPADLGPLGKKNIRFIVLKHISDEPGVETYKERKEKIFYLENGLSLNNQQVGFISDICQLPNLADYVLCFIDISDVSPEETNIFHSSREEFANTQDYKHLKDKLRVVFEDPKFLELQREYKNKDILNTQLLDKDTNKLLESALREDAELLKDLELGEDLQIQSGGEEPQYPEPEEQYIGQYLPAKFELIGSDSREVQEGAFTIISFKTEAVDNFLDRTNDQGICDASSKLFSIVRRAPKKGIVSFRVEPKDGVSAGVEETLEFKLEVPDKNFSKTANVNLKVIPKKDFIGQAYPSFITPQKEVFKIPLNETRKLNFKTDANNDFFTSNRGKLNFSSDDLELTGFRLRNGNLQLTLKCVAKKIGKKDDIKVDVQADNGVRFPMTIPLEVVEDEESEKFKKPPMLPVTRENWKARGWDENGLDIAEVTKDIDGLTVWYNPESKAWTQIKGRIRTEDIVAAEQKYQRDCYIQALHLYFEFKDESDSKTYVRRSMKALGKSMPVTISKLFRS